MPLGGNGPPQGDGYPYVYFVRACDVAEVLVEHGGPPNALYADRGQRDITMRGPRAELVVKVTAQGSPSAWCLLEVWDES